MRGCVSIGVRGCVSIGVRGCVSIRVRGCVSIGVIGCVSIGVGAVSVLEWIVCVFSCDQFPIEIKLYLNAFL